MYVSVEVIALCAGDWAERALAGSKIGNVVMYLITLPDVDKVSSCSIARDLLDSEISYQLLLLLLSDLDCARSCCNSVAEVFEMANQLTSSLVKNSSLLSQTLYLAAVHTCSIVCFSYFSEVSSQVKMGCRQHKYYQAIELSSRPELS